MMFDSRFRIIVKTNRPKTEVLGYNKERGAYDMNVAGEAREGKANLEIIKHFKKKYKKDARIISGFKSKEKIISLE